LEKGNREGFYFAKDFRKKMDLLDPFHFYRIDFIFFGERFFSFKNTNPQKSLENGYPYFSFPFEKMGKGEGG
jgi:hypothetical protein